LHSSLSSFTEEEVEVDEVEVLPWALAVSSSVVEDGAEALALAEEVASVVSVVVALEVVGQGVVGNILRL
jgi:hypothetical protein